ncbi:ribbon-helix-helix domain-containing protein [Alishewanella jeotgali]|uniref:CopG family transcriptional regulator n=1 Tax=Alishewanella jeotgali KCTC 22429 TaxID=1129374 RepID=H3ZIS6_9ALTE|nr:hypothetical protein [Alishewanella jeotgali]EHR39527.1 hypothetical protein AJE_16444 [Alishewanella jeotgali KCTC 22429]
MTRQSVTLSQANEQWLQEKVQNAHEYNSKSELINELIRNARRADAINQKLAAAEAAGFTDKSAEQILAEFKRKLLIRAC